MYFMYIFPAYRIFVWLFFGLWALRGMYAIVSDPLNETPLKWQQLLIVIPFGAVLFAAIWLLRDVLTDDLSRGSVFLHTALLASMMLYPFNISIYTSGRDFWHKDRAMIYLARVLFAILIALVDAAIYFLDLLPLPNELSVGGEALLWICILALYSFALTQVFFRLELKIFFQSDNNSDSYNAWLVIPAFTTGNLLFWLWFF
jgi:hypothetical protein